MAPIGTLEQRLLAAITTIAPKEASIMVVLVVPGDLRGVDLHVAQIGDPKRVEFGALEYLRWLRAQGVGHE